MFRIKICGVTSADDARQTADAGADAVGLNFYPPSVRYVAPHAAAQIAAALPASITRVGVFVNSTAAQIVVIARHVPLDLIQLHGDESPDLAAELVATGWPVLRAFRCGADLIDESLRWLDSFRQRGGQLAGILLDAPASGQYGGTGSSADWSVIDRLRRATGDCPLVLAGGLKPDNVAAAIEATHCEAVDTASGVETAPGRKNPALVTRFVEEARRAFALRRA